MLEPVQAQLYSGIGLLCVAAIVLGVRRNRPSCRAGWYLIAAGQAATLLGDLLWYGHEFRYGVAPPYPSLLDGVYLLTYPLTAWGVVMLIRTGSSAPDDGSLIDGLIVATSVGLPAWAFLISPYAYDESLTVAEQLVSMAYPLMDVLLVAGALVLFSLVLLRMSGLVRQVEANVDELHRQGETLARTVATLRSTEAERKMLLDKVLRAAEEERIRIAAELHDRPIQQLTSLSYDLELARVRFEQGRGEAACEVLAAVQRSLAENVHGLRRLMSSLRPPALDERGLQAALRDQAEAFGERAHVHCTVDADLRTRLDPELETVLYRVAQEALTNVAKHAHASHAWVQLKEQDGAVELRLKDDGIGFIPEAIPDLAREGHFGLIAIRERIQMAGGWCELESRPGGGTTIRAIFKTTAVAA